jgi:hypothetical protein
MISGLGRSRSAVGREDFRVGAVCKLTRYAA